MTSFSVVVPVYNCESTLNQAINSILQQLETYDEIVIVDDFSTDSTFKIANAFTKTDNRVKVYRMSRNRGRLFARVEGVMKSTREKILFLDGDDEFSPDALNILRKEIEENDAEILHFGLSLWVTNDNRSYLDENASKWFAPLIGQLNNADVFKKCFCERKYNWNLVNKCFDASLCRKACCFIPPFTVQRGDDACLYFIIAYFAKSYRGIDFDLYRYNYGAGQDSSRTIGSQEFAELCKSTDALRAIDAFLQAEGEIDVMYRKGFEQTHLALIDGCCNKLRDSVAKSEFTEAAAFFVKEWGRPAAIAAFARSFGEGGARFADMMKPLSEPVLKPGDTLASFYFKFTGGGAENVQRMLVKTWRSLGLNVVLLMEEEPDEQIVSEIDIEWRVLPKAELGRAERVRAIENAVSDFNIKGVVYHQWVREGLFWDCLAFKQAGAAFFIHCHGIFTHCASDASAYFAEMPRVYRHADAIISLSDIDAVRWRRSNPRTFVTINPASFPTAQEFSKPKGKRVLWLGRISPEKRPIEALDVFSHVLDLVPNAKMDFVGGSINQAYEKSVIDHAKKIGLEDAVDFAGWQDNRAEYYKQACVFLMTSEPKEGYPLTLGECQSFGVPCVMYELPYLTLTRTSKGIHQVPFGDVKEAARAVARILENDSLREDMAKAALDTANQLESFNFNKLWNTVLFSRNLPNHISYDEDSERIAWQTMDLAYSAGVELKKQEIKRLEQHIESLNAKDKESQKKISQMKEQESRLVQQEKELKAKEKSLRNSKSFKIGRAITYIPRKAKRLAQKTIGGGKR